MRQLQGKTAIVTGASRGLGARLAKALAAEGMQLVLVARNAQALEEVRGELAQFGTRVVTLALDLAQPASLQKLTEAALDHFGRIDVLVNNAGLDQCANYLETRPALIEQIIQVNLTAPMLLTQLVLPGMIQRGEGHIINIASLAGLCGTPYNEAYSATKHALIGFTRSLRLTVASEGYPIGVSVICPGFVSDTGMTQSMIDDTAVAIPAILGTSTPEAVINATLAAIRNDAPETIVSSVPMRPMLVGALLMPRLSERFARLFGLVSALKHVAAAAAHRHGDRVLSGHGSETGRARLPPRDHCN